MNEQMFTIGPIMKAARKFKKFNQADVAQAIGCSQSALSKMEHNLLIPSAPQWFLFSRFTSIPPESLETGIIDRNAPIKFNNSDISLGFKIPKRYRLHRGSKVRELYPFLQVLEKESPQLVTEFIQSTGIEPEFFLDFDNLINFHLFADMITFYMSKGKTSVDSISKLVEMGQNKIYWDHFVREWKRTGDIGAVLAHYLDNQVFFQMDFQLRLDTIPGGFAVSYSPEHHTKQMAATVSDEFVNFLNQYRKYSLRHLIQTVLGQDVRVEQVQERITPSSLAARFEIRSSM